MSVIADMQKLGPDTEVWVVKTAILYYLRGGETALRRLGDKDYSEFRRFADGYMDIQRSEDFRHKAITSNAPDYRGLICCVMDDLGMRDRDQRDRILKALTGADQCWTKERP